MYDKLKYAIMNIVVPGAGQLAMKRFARGAIMLLSALFLMALLMWEVLKPTLIAVYNFLNDTERPLSFNWTSFAVLFLLLAAVWIASFADIIFSGRKK